MSLGKYPSSQVDPTVVKALLEEIAGWIKTVEELVEELPEADAPAANKIAFQNYKKFCTDIATKLTTYSRTERDKYYRYLQRSKGRLDTIKRVIATATKTAKLFERYQKKPLSYSEVDSKVNLNKLLAELKNLRERCRES